MTQYKILFHPKAEKELANLDRSVQIMVLKQIKKLEYYPMIGELLGNKHGYDLSGYRKLYVNKKSIRIVYKLIEDMILVKIIAIGKRNDFEVYQNASSRIE